MSNLDVYLPAVDGSAYVLHSKDESCKEAIHTLFSDDYAAPPRQLVIEVRTESGKNVKVFIPYSDDQPASVYVDGQEI